MQKYTWESLRKDPEQREELLSILNEMEEKAKLSPEELQKYESTNIYNSVKYRAKRIRNISDRLTETLGDAKRQSDFEDCMANMADTLSEMQKNQPEKYGKIMDIKGYWDVLDSVKPLVPKPGTAGARSVWAQNRLYFSGPKDLLESPGASSTFNDNYLAINELTKGAADWRSVPIDDETYRKTCEEYAEIYNSYSDTIYPPDHEGLVDYLQAPGRNAQTYEMAYPLFIKGAKEALEGKKESLVDCLTGADRNDMDVVSNRFCGFMTASMISRMPAKGGDIAQAKNETLRYAEACARLAEGFTKSLSADKLVELTDNGKKLEKAFRKHIAALDQLPEGLPDSLAPSAKERIEALQERLQAEPEADKKLRLTAEIIATREAVSAKRGGKGLDNKLVFDVSERAEELAAEMGRVYAEDQKGRDKLFAQALDGHGGKMMEAYQETAAERVTYNDYINKLDLEDPKAMDVAKLVAATGGYYEKNVGADTLANARELDKAAKAISKQPAFQNLLKDPKAMECVKNGLGLPLLQKLQAEMTRKNNKPEPEREVKKTVEEQKKDVQTVIT